MNYIAVYCGSSPGTDPQFMPLARAFGDALAGAGLGLVYGGGQVGLMGAVADGVLARAGSVIGVIPQFLETKEIAHPDPRVDLRVVHSMHERKALISATASAFVALPGGYGTFEEFFETVTWVQLGLVRKPVILLNAGGYYDPLVALVDAGVSGGFISPANRDLFAVERTVAGTMARLTSG
jgi:uncharacterized protein (TIGR00730 family)